MICPIVFIALVSLLFLIAKEKYANPRIFSKVYEPVPFAKFGVVKNIGEWRFGLVAMTEDKGAGFIAEMNRRYPGFDAGRALGYTEGQAPPSVTRFSVASFADFTKVFETDGALESYVRSKDYESQPKVGGAVVLRSEQPVFDYTIRGNVTALQDTSTSGAVDTTGRDQDDQFVRRYMMFQTTFSTLDYELDPAALLLPGFTGIQMAMEAYAINASAAVPQDDADMRRAFWQAFPPLWDDLGDAAVLASDFADAAEARGVDVGRQTPNVTDPARQRAFDAEARAMLAGFVGVPQSAQFQTFPRWGFTYSPLWSSVTQIFSLLFVLLLGMPVFFQIRGMVSERELKIREGLLMMGMHEMVLPWAWFITYFVIWTVIAVGVVAVTTSHMFQHTGATVVFLLFWLFGLATIQFCYLVAALFDRARTAAVMGAMLHLVSFFPYYRVVDRSGSQKALACLLPASGFGLGLDVLAKFETDGTGITLSRLDLEADGLSIGHVLSVLLIDIFIYHVLGWYLERVWPHEFGTRQPVWFFLLPSYWFPNRRGWAGDRPSYELHEVDKRIPLLSADAGPDVAADAGPSPGPGATPAVTKQGFEAPGEALRELERQGRCVKIDRLRKEFSTPDGTKVAVNDIDLTIYEGQVLCWLGANGAGKTTSLSMLGGLLRPTSGDATMYGLSIRSQLAQIRRSLGIGVCPQHDVLFPDLTVKEHLELFAGLKGVPRASRAEAVRKAIAEVGLTEKVNALSKTLSGGMKRKLSVAIALLGGSKVVFLDEPTSGVDPYSRRSMWNVIRNNREGRIIILTTHFMDEADMLGDRIAIMADGEIRCLGSSMFLKRLFGVGYNLTLIKRPGCDPRAVTSAVRGHVPAARMLSNVGAEISFQLPLGAAPQFVGLFGELDGSLERLQLTDYGLSVTTMEEVFLKVVEGGNRRDQEETRQLSRQLSSDRLSTGRRLSTGAAEVKRDGGEAAEEQRRLLPLSGHSDGAAGAGAGAGAGGGPGSSRDLERFGADREREPSLDVASLRRTRSFFWTHFVALFIKRMHYARRDWKMAVFQMLIPAVALTLILALMKAGQPSDADPLVMDTSLFNPAVAGPLQGTSRMPFLVDAAADDAAAIMAHAPAGGVGVAVQAPGYGQGLYSNDTVCQLLLAEDECDNSDGACKITALEPNPGPLNVTSSEICGVAFNHVSTLAKTTPLALALIMTREAETASRYGAVAFRSADLASSQAEVALLVNTTARHSPGIFLNQLSNTLLRATASARSGPGAQRSSIRLVNHPMPWTAREEAFTQAVGGFVTAFFVVIAYAFIGASQAVFIVKERETAVKHQQLISGVSIPAYWLASYAWDCANYLVPWAASIALIYAFDVQSFTKSGNFTIVTLLFLGFGLATPPFTYVTSFLFTKHTKALALTLLFNLFLAFVVMITFILNFISSTCKVSGGLAFVFSLFPGYSLGNGLMRVSILDALPSIKADCDDDPSEALQTYRASDFEVAGVSLVYLFVGSALYLTTVILIDVALSYPSIQKRITRVPEVHDPPVTEDDDVAEETARIDAKPDSAGGGPDEEDVLVLRHLRKVYPNKKVAVRDLSFGVAKGEVFGFLGINGAGKTTTLQMLSGDLVPSSGGARLAGYDILTQQIEVRRKLGYCPQFSALLELLTVREHLELFARIKGYKGDAMERLVEAKLREMQLSEYEHRKAGTLSGGNKRKLSVAIALMSSPEIVFLDEPSTGVDPVARRFMWNVISRVATERRESAVILTSHLLEEVEALCTRVGIMVGGRLRCLGSIQHLKNKFGKGLMCEIKLEDPAQEVVEQLRRHLQGALGGEGRVTEATIGAACAHLGDPSRAAQFSETGSAWLLLSAMRRDGGVGPEQVATWWEMENQAVRLCHELHAMYPGSMLLERHGEFFRFQLNNQGAPIGQVFGRMEEKREELQVREYSISQTTLEQVFNMFASQQEEETAEVAGFVRQPSFAKSTHSGLVVQVGQ